MLKVFRKAGYLKTRIIDCTEVRIEQSKSKESEAVTWSDYKNHAFKFLVASSCTGYIMFISDTYGGRTPDQFICKDRCFIIYLSLMLKLGR